ncbi:outer membrane receptor for ferrienterochelin and colicins [Alistipes sp. CAG:268]|jgi:outer membrane receptor for ferrienterochelin and colicins|uniref:TonB-dependent receptor n=1 Tax=Alistipes sp. CAG:268 TaxID=1262693 RepID=UPI00033F17CF|nr:TonB-dependent receptor [Alistipes sp. CAG:268]CDC96822.1 outer membrane receptor for ferrienterochelin and colicins [Alistipes sp. CAG:268]
MHIRLISAITLLALGVCAPLRAQELRGEVRDAEGRPLAGASVYWAGTTVGTSADGGGAFRLHRVKGRELLVASFLGYVNDTLRVDAATQQAAFGLRAEGVELEGVVVEAVQSGNFVKRDGIVKGEMISFAGLCKMACCNLAESFENSASVTVGYSDAISGARQIKMLGLAGTYTQILDENRPVMRGLSAPYGLSYTPGMWLNSIQVSKGVASVTAGHDAITGQINLEHRKPTDEERLFVNLYLDDELRPEANISTAFPVSRDGKLSSVLLLHGSADTDVRKMDHNGDGFRDLPRSAQFNVANKWLYAADNGMQIRWGWKYVEESRLGGMLDYRNTRSMREAMAREWDWERTGGTMPLYGSHIRNRNANGYFKLGMPVGASVYDADAQDEKRSNLALVADFDHFDEEAYFGLNDYAGRQNSVSVQAMYNHYFTYRSSLNVGVQARLDYIRESLLNRTPWIDGRTRADYDWDRNEEEVGAYAEYTYAVRDRFSVVAGLRGDYNAFYDRFFLTPRGHVKWNITPSTTLRASAGLGYRSTNVLTDNIGMLATGRAIVVPELGDLDRLEQALTVGGSLTQTFGLVKPGDATLSFDYFRTQFFHAVVVDQEYDPETIRVYGSSGPSWTDTYQIDFSWSPVERLDLFATFRYTDSEMTIRRSDGRPVQVDRPLVSRYKTLLNIQYATKFRRWVFDATAQLNGPARIPTQTGDLADSRHSPRYPMFYAQVSRKVGRFDIYVGCENIADYRQEDPILNWENPYDYRFNSMNVWGPLMGRKFYAGLRFNLY